VRRRRFPAPTVGIDRRVVWLALAFTALQTPRAQVDPDLLSGMKARSIGPAGMSGRVAAITAEPGNPNVVWVGAATGGLWRSDNAGLTWRPMFDREPVASISAVAIHPLRRVDVWVGTGEGNPRNSASVGNGMYRSRDGGRTWQHLGLADSERIHRIVLHPENPEVAFVGALGKTWGESDERGVFKTPDGGRTWRRVLSDNATTGCADLVADPQNPDKLIAALWDHRRWPWSFRSGGPGSGLCVTVDGGETWRRLGPHDGLPTGELGRIGVAFAPSDPQVVYALIEAKQNALYGSTDGGVSWRRINDDRDVMSRPFYYADLRVDPRDPRRIYDLATVVRVSQDGGRTFRTLVGWQQAHPDHHALWIDPDDPRHLFAGNDGGLYESRDHGGSWRFCANLPLAQYYHVRVDHETPFHVYGGMQDNGSWRGPSQVWENGGIRNHHWHEVAFGDGFDTSPDPADAMHGYAMSQQGYLVRYDLRTGERRDIRPAPPDGVKLRFNWSAGFAQDPFDAATIWYGSQLVHRSTGIGRRPRPRAGPARRGMEGAVAPPRRGRARAVVAARGQRRARRRPRVRRGPLRVAFARLVVGRADRDAAFLPRRRPRAGRAGARPGARAVRRPDRTLPRAGRRTRHHAPAGAAADRDPMTRGRSIRNRCSHRIPWRDPGNAAAGDATSRSDRLASGSASRGGRQDHTPRGLFSRPHPSSLRAAALRRLWCTATRSPRRGRVVVVARSTAPSMKWMKQPQRPARNRPFGNAATDQDPPSR
jgi:photosystem II stability/assembly factor-like uncharacterized protein